VPGDQREHVVAVALGLDRADPGDREQVAPRVRGFASATATRVVSWKTTYAGAPDAFEMRRRHSTNAS
jgi:hypothetical protein